MENIENSDFEQLEKLFRNKQFEKVQEIEPQPLTKTKLDKAFAARRKPTPFFQIKMPLYQSVAATLVFFFFGFALNQSKQVQTRIVHNRTEVIKYVDRPLKQIVYVTIPAKNKNRNTQLRPMANTAPTIETIDENEITIPESNPEILRQQEIAMTNINRALNEKNGSSMSGDTVLQKMMVTVY
ncbi:MAG: hypothetical protein QM800_14990 [Paludibacter sp.]